MNTEEISRFVPSQDELFQLTKHWVKEAISDEWFIFWGQCFGSSDLRRIDADWNRVAEIKAILGIERTEIAIEEAYQEAAQVGDRNSWIIFRYGTGGERAAYQELGGQCFDNFDGGVAEWLASRVMKRVFRGGAPNEQESLLKEELSRYAAKLRSFKIKGFGVIEVFGIYFPCEIKPLVLTTGVNDPEPSQDNTFHGTLTVEQGKAFLTALEAVSEKGEDALKALVMGNNRNAPE